MDTPYTISRDASGHWLVSKGEARKPVALFYAHNAPDFVARRRAEKFIKKMELTDLVERLSTALKPFATAADRGDELNRQISAAGWTGPISRTAKGVFGINYGQLCDARDALKLLEQSANVQADGNQEAQRHEK